jgi:hypothetical protein
MVNNWSREKLTKRIRVLLWLFIVGLVLSGVTAFPLLWELNILARWLGASETALPDNSGSLWSWVVTVRNGLRNTYSLYPFIAYGTDWLAFAHLMIAASFIGPLRDPVRNVWVIEWAMLCCVAIIPLALICGPVRGIPFYWQLIDCSFGVVGIVPLWLCRKYIRALEASAPYGRTINQNSVVLSWP